MVAPERYRARLEEPVIPEDASSGVDGRLPSYNAYSADGDVTAELVYVNYGIPGDYEELERRGIDVRGKIIIARYGGSWRGIKPKLAHEKGAVATILYSDPRDDGYFQGGRLSRRSLPDEVGACRGVRLRTCLSTQAIHSRPSWAPPRTPSATRSKRRRPS